MSIRYEWEHHEVAELARDLARVPDDVNSDLHDIVRENAKLLAVIWRRNAKVSSGEHGKLFPLTIFDHVNGLSAYIEPKQGMPQAGMQFEYGAPSVIRNPNPSGRGGKLGQPVGQTKPHMNMNRAADIVFPLFHKEVADQADIWMRA